MQYTIKTIYEIIKFFLLTNNKLIVLNKKMSDKYIPNSYQTPNAIVDNLASLLSDKAFKVYHVIVRKTLGWCKESDKISVTQIMTITNTKRRETIYKVIQELESYNLIEVIKENGKLNRYKIKLDNITSTNKPYYYEKEVVLKNRTTPVLKNRTGTSTNKPYTTKHNIKHTNKTHKKNI